MLDSVILSPSKIFKKMTSRSQDKWLYRRELKAGPKHPFRPLISFFSKFYILHCCLIWYPVIMQSFLIVSPVWISKYLTGLFLAKKKRQMTHLLIKKTYGPYSHPKLSNKLWSRSQIVVLIWTWNGGKTLHSCTKNSICFILAWLWYCIF